MSDGGASVYLELRDLLLEMNPYDHGFEPTERLPHLWGVMVEVGFCGGSATLVSLADGTTSLYLSNGETTVGVGEAAPVASASRRLVALADAAMSRVPPIWDQPLPEPGRARFVFLTYQGPVGAEAGEAELNQGSHPLSAAYKASGKVLTQIDRLRAAIPPAT